MEQSDNEKRKQNKTIAIAEGYISGDEYKKKKKCWQGQSSGSGKKITKGYS